jgi:ribosomal protein S20
MLSESTLCLIIFLFAIFFMFATMIHQENKQNKSIQSFLDYQNDIYLLIKRIEEHLTLDTSKLKKMQNKIEKMVYKAEMKGLIHDERTTN